MSRGGQLLCDTKKCQVSGYKSKFAELSSSESEGEELSEPLKENLQNRLNREAFKKTLVNKQNKARQVPVSVIPNQQIQFSTLSLD